MNQPAASITETCLRTAVRCLSIDASMAADPVAAGKESGGCPAANRTSRIGLVQNMGTSGIASAFSAANRPATKISQMCAQRAEKFCGREARVNLTKAGRCHMIGLHADEIEWVRLLVSLLRHAD